MARDSDAPASALSTRLHRVHAREPGARNGASLGLFLLFEQALDEGLKLVAWQRCEAHQAGVQALQLRLAHRVEIDAPATLLGLSAAPVRSVRPSTTSTLRFGPAFTPANANWSTARRPGLPSISGRESPRKRVKEKFLSPAQSKTSWPVRASRSSHAV
jgi:hypothetical protein